MSDELKSKFSSGSKPTGEDFALLIDTLDQSKMVSLIQDGVSLISDNQIILNENLEIVNEKIDELEVEELDLKVSTIESDVFKVQEALLNIKEYDDSEILERVVTVESSIEKLKTSVENIENYDDTALSEKVVTLENKVSTFENYDDTALNEKVVTLENKVVEQDSQISSAKQDVKALVEGVVAVDDRMDDLELRIEEVNSNLATTSESLTTVENSVITIGENLAYQSPNIVGTQLQLKNSNIGGRVFIKMDNSLEGGVITVSLDNGKTSRNVVDVNGEPVVTLEKGFHELVVSDSFFTLRNKSGLSSADLKALVTTTGSDSKTVTGQILAIQDSKDKLAKKLNEMNIETSKSESLESIVDKVEVRSIQSGKIYPLSDIGINELNILTTTTNIEGAFQYVGVIGDDFFIFTSGDGFIKRYDRKTKKFKGNVNSSKYSTTTYETFVAIIADELYYYALSSRGATFVQISKATGETLKSFRLNETGWSMGKNYAYLNFMEGDSSKIVATAKTTSNSIAVYNYNIVDGTVTLVRTISIQNNGDGKASAIDGYLYYPSSASRMAKTKIDSKEPTIINVGDFGDYKAVAKTSSGLYLLVYHDSAESKTYLKLIDENEKVVKEYASKGLNVTPFYEAYNPYTEKLYLYGTGSIYRYDANSCSLDYADEKRHYLNFSPVDARYIPHLDGSITGRFYGRTYSDGFTTVVGTLYDSFQFVK